METAALPKTLLDMLVRLCLRRVRASRPGNGSVTTSSANPTNAVGDAERLARIPFLP